MSRPRPGLPIAACIALGWVALLSACYDLAGPRACTLEAVAGIVIDLRTESGQALTAVDATGRAVDGALIANLEPFFDQLIGAWEQPGTFVVTVEKPGFEPWIRQDVRVEPGECHVTPARLEAVLSPRP
ncbi:MAG TPA: carboxypeptidase-like regulatory domain-containing protein [Gemmatimonadota bacterium]|nr:carboxypeptidase-like regulatory domain-containing protein [Gemmatimonadota bacterium]